MEWEKILNKNRIFKTNDNLLIDNRTEFEKDYHSIIMSASFRRMQDKTQVFPLSKSDFIRTRLTHSLETSTLAKILGDIISTEIIEKNIDPGFMISYKKDMSDVLQCAGLIHDIGNPPFGHFGEIAIRTWFKNNLSVINYKDVPIDKYLNEKYLNDLYNFDGNAQGLHLLTRLVYYDNDYGMNLTYAILSTIIKYHSNSTDVSNLPFRNKMGYFICDSDIYKEINDATGITTRNPLTFILEISDDIAYATADIQDGFKKGFISLDLVKNELSNINDKHINDIINDAQNLKLPSEEYEFKYIISKLQALLIKESQNEFVKHYSDIMQGNFNNSLLDNSEYIILLQVLKNIGHKFIFNTDYIYSMEVSTWKVYEFLLDLFVKSLLYYDTNINNDITPIAGKITSMISDNYLMNYNKLSQDKSEEEKLYLRLLLAIDVVAGMTDGHARDLYHEFSGIKK